MQSLTFERLSPSYKGYYLKWFNDVDVRQFLADSTPKTEKEIEQWLEEIEQDKNQDYLAILSLNDNADVVPVGHIGAKKNKNACEISIVIGNKKYWGKGIGNTALGFMLRRYKGRITHPFAYIHDNNVPSIKLFEKNGFTYSHKSKRPDVSVYAKKEVV